MISKETLMAYVDGELDENARAQVEAAMALDPPITHEVERQQMLRARLGSAFDEVLNEPVPQRLLDTARTAPAAEHKATVTDLSSARASAAETRSRRWTAGHWGAMAASLVIGVWVGGQPWQTPDTSTFTSKNGQLVARGLLAQALTHRLSGEQSDADHIRIALSFKDAGGHYCRAFAIQDSSALAGLACHENDAWQLKTLAQGKTTADSGEKYRMASSALPPAVMLAADQAIAGEPLAAAEETAARDAGWR